MKKGNFGVWSAIFLGIGFFYITRNIFGFLFGIILGPMLMIVYAKNKKAQ